MDLNPFRLCTGLKFLGYFMILLVFSIIAVSYCAVVVLTWGPHLLDGGANSFLSFIIIAVFHLLLFYGCPSGPRCCSCELEMSPEQNVGGNSVISFDPTALEDPATMPSSSERRPERGYCSRCQNGKPPRCHHCSVCQRCVLKMDHHCIWVVNCVGARNYKFFLLFVLYTFLETTMDTLVLLPNFVNFFKHASHHSASPGKLAVTFLAFVLNLAFALSLLCFIIMHSSLLASNTTSVEVYEKKRSVRWKYDLGWKTNFEQVFGTRKLYWFFPVFAKEDLENIPALHGLDYPTRADIEA